VCEDVGVESKYLSDIFEPSFSSPGHERFEGFAVTSLKPVVDDARLVIKRAIDLVGATLALVLLSPLFVISAIAIKLTSNGPIIFTQERHGRNRRPFKMYKFRTMVQNAEALQASLEHQNEVAGPVFKIRNDPRVTRVGSILRRTSLDELPQLLNVVRGDMSLVGPRPLPMRDVARFEEGWLLRRFCVLPGITGLWQINGRSSSRFEDWVQHDFEYINAWSLKLDLKILLKTVPVVWRGGGAV
jgi:exopolysaccharide biosynthesis polyprenyl glycosylphosphotransferase